MSKRTLSIINWTRSYFGVVVMWAIYLSRGHV